MTPKFKKTSWIMCSDPECSCYGELSKNGICTGHKVDLSEIQVDCVQQMSMLNLKETDDLKLLRAIERDIKIWKDSKNERP